MSAQWLTVIYSALICFGGGSLAFLGISEATGMAPKARKAAAIAAALLLLAGGVVFVSSLGKPAAAMAIAANALKGSPKSLEFVTMIACVVAAVVYVVVSIRSESETAPKVIGILCLVLGVLMGILAGNSSALGRASWTGIVLPLAWTGSALAFGGALYCSLSAIFKEEDGDLRKLVFIALLGTVVQAAGFIAYGVCTGFAVDPLLYWLGAVAVGTVVTLLCLFASLKVRALVFAALICSAAGGICIRLVLLSLGTTSLGLLGNAISRTPL